MQFDQLVQLVDKRHRIIRRQILRPEELLCSFLLLSSAELGSIGYAARQIRKCPWKNWDSMGHHESSLRPHTNALNKKTLTSRNLPRLLNILQSSLGFLPSIICGLEGLDEVGFFQ